jgi:carboxymethylenebutenolidase
MVSQAIPQEPAVLPTKDADRFLAGACPIVGSFGAKDWSLPGVAGRLERALSVAGVEHDVKE